MKLRVEFDIDNDAYQIDGKWLNYGQVAETLNEVANRITAGIIGPDAQKIRDINGNTVGKYQIVDFLN